MTMYGLVHLSSYMHYSITILSLLILYKIFTQLENTVTKFHEKSYARNRPRWLPFACQLEQTSETDFGTYKSAETLLKERTMAPLPPFIHIFRQNTAFDQ